MGDGLKEARRAKSTPDDRATAYRFRLEMIRKFCADSLYGQMVMGRAEAGEDAIRALKYIQVNLSVEPGDG